jgi:hypothetical protein
MGAAVLLFLNELMCFSLQTFVIASKNFQLISWPFFVFSSSFFARLTVLRLKSGQFLHMLDATVRIRPHLI